MFSLLIQTIMTNFSSNNLSRVPHISIRSFTDFLHFSSFVQTFQSLKTHWLDIISLFRKKSNNLAPDRSFYDIPFLYYPRYRNPDRHTVAGRKKNICKIIFLHILVIFFLTRIHTFFHFGIFENWKFCGEFNTPDARRAVHANRIE